MLRLEDGQAALQTTEFMTPDDQPGTQDPAYST